MAWAMRDLRLARDDVGARGAHLRRSPALILVVVARPGAARRPRATQKGSVLTLLAMPALWAIFPLMFVNYAPVGGSARRSGPAPIWRDVFGMDADGIGTGHAGDGARDDRRQLRLRPARPDLRHPQMGDLHRQPRLGGLRSSRSGLFPASGVWTATLLMAAAGLFGAVLPADHGPCAAPSSRRT